MGNMQKLLKIKTSCLSLRGASILEIILAVTILSILASGITVSIIRYQTRSDLDVAVLSGVEALRRAEFLSRAVRNKSGWGVAFATGTITVFKGGDFALRDASFDEVIEVSPLISITGNTEVAFSSVSATTSDIGTTSLMHLSIGDSRDIHINIKGGINY